MESLYVCPMIDGITCQKQVTHYRYSLGSAFALRARTKEMIINCRLQQRERESLENMRPGGNDTGSIDESFSPTEYPGMHVCWIGGDAVFAGLLFTPSNPGLTTSRCTSQASHSATREAGGKAGDEGTGGGGADPACGESSLSHSA